MLERLNSVVACLPVLSGMVLCLAAPIAARAAAPPSETAAPYELVVVDEDWNVPGDHICEAHLPLLLVDPHVQVVGLTAMSGDAWLDEGAANILRFLEEIGHPEIPVAKGPVFPLVNTRARQMAWEKRFGEITWHGAWNSPAREAGAHPDTPFAIRYAREGPPRHEAVAESAPAMMIRLVHQYPHRITFISGGPLTNFAIAIRLDPQFASLAKRLIREEELLTGIIDGTAAAGRKPNFDIAFDPEAAHIALTANWPEIVFLERNDQDPVPDAKWVADVDKRPTAATRYWANNIGFGEGFKGIGFGTPLWSGPEALVSDPSLILSEKQYRLRLDVDVNDQSPLFGSYVLAPTDGYDGPDGGARVTVITGFDWKRYTAEYIASLQSPLMRALK